MSRHIISIARKRVWIILFWVFVGLAAFQGILQIQEWRYLREVANDVISKAGATTTEEKILALRDFIRKNVDFKGAPVTNRPFLRATAAETLKSGKGYCGEVSRTFICLAEIVGIPAQRINLYGREPHTVAEAELPSGQTVIVDCQNPPPIEKLQRLDILLQQGKYDDYSTLNLRRTGLDLLITRLKLRIGPLTYLSENPHALKLLFFLCLAGLIIMVHATRWSFRTILRRRGWIHVSDRDQVKKALGQQPLQPDTSAMSI